MSVRVIIGPFGSGKTDELLAELRKLSPAEHECGVRFITPSIAIAVQVRRLLLSDPGFLGFFGDPVCTFYELAREILSAARLPIGRRITDTERQAVIKEIVRGDISLSTFRKICDTPNFAPALLSTIGRLKRSGVSPDDLLTAGSARDLAAVYRRYRDDFLAEKGLHDREDLIARAAEAIESGQVEFRTHALVDGFQRFSVPERRLIRLLAETLRCDLTISVDYEEGRPAVFSHMDEHLEFLSKLPGTTLERREPRREGLPAQVARRVFSAHHEKLPPGEGITVMVGGTPALEAELVAREIRRLIRDHGYSLRDAGVVALSADSYRGRLEDAFRMYGLPFTGSARPLREVAPARAVLLGIRVIRGGWAREDVLRLLQPGCIGLGADVYHRILHEHPATKRSEWFSSWGPEDETLEDRARALSPLRAFEDALTPGAEGMKRAVEAFLSTLHQPEEEADLVRDWAARRSLTRTMDGTVRAEKTIGRPMETAEFFALLETAILSGTCRIPAGTEEGVTLLEPGLIGGRKFRALFFLGLTDTALPGRRDQDPFLHDDEFPVPVQHGPARERYLFYSVISSALERLYLCYPSSRPQSGEAFPSPYIAEVDALFQDKVSRVHRNALRSVPTPADAESPEELASSVIHGLVAPSDEADQEIYLTLYNTLLDARLISPEDFPR